MASGDILTKVALKAHDKVHPKFQAIKGPESTSKKKESSFGSVLSNSETRRRRTISMTTETTSIKSGSTMNRNQAPSTMTFYRAVLATQASQTWKRFTKFKKQPTPQLKPILPMENTYRTEPTEGTKFSPHRVEKMLKEVLEASLKNVPYSAERCRLVTTDLSSLIKGKIKMMNFPRYKVVCNVFLMEKQDQGTHITSRAVWNSDTDNSATYSFDNGSLIATAIVHGMYLE